MRILITGVCGFVGSQLAKGLSEAFAGTCGKLELSGMDNFSRPGSERNRGGLKKLGVQFFYGDLRSPSDLDELPRVDWVIDAAANPSVLAGIDGRTSSRQIIEHNLISTINLMEYCKRHDAGFILISTSRVFSIKALGEIPIANGKDAYRLDGSSRLPVGVSVRGVAEMFSTQAPVSLYGASKLASEAVALEYGMTFGFPVWINRCGILAGAGQFGRADQGILSYWMNAYLRRRPLKYLGFNGSGLQTRDCLNPQDLASLLIRQIRTNPSTTTRVFNVGGGTERQFSLRQLSEWCAQRFGPHPVQASGQPRRFDIPWLVMDSSKAQETWHWQPRSSREEIFEEIALHAEANPDWLDISAS